MRGSLAEKTSEFMETQLDEARRKLEEQEAKVEAFRIRHSGRLPSQQMTNLQVYQNTQVQLNQLLESVARDEDRKTMLERIYNETLRDPAPVTPAPAAAQTGGDSQSLPTGGSPERRLAAARAMLANLELRLKPEHPDVRRKKREIADLEREVAAAPSTPGGDTASAQTGSLPQDDLRRDRLRQQRAEIEMLGRQIRFKQSEGERLRRELADYRSRLEAVPSLESEETSLTRDLVNLTEAYKLLKTKSEDSKVAANLEVQQIGEQFRVLDMPRLAPKAEAGGRLRSNLMGVGLGLLLGLAIVGLLEFMDTSFRTEADVVNALSLPVVALVPYAPTAADLARARRGRLLFMSSGMAVVTAGAAVFWYMQLWKYIV
jgi:succinoglycan biosynthesis transport protein ExoP